LGRAQGNTREKRRQSSPKSTKCSVEDCAERDPKGLYKKASAGQIEDLTGSQDLYDEPMNPGLILYTEKLTVAEGVEVIESKLQELNLI
jgi:adenylylsulfate kinase